MRTRPSVMTVVLLTALGLGGIARAQAPRRTLVIGMPVTPPNLPHVGVYVAKDLGYFEEEGINVDFAQLNRACWPCAAVWPGDWIFLGPAANQ